MSNFFYCRGLKGKVYFYCPCGEGMWRGDWKKKECEDFGVVFTEVEISIVKK